MSHDWISDPVQALDQAYLLQAQQRQAELTKPPGSLGQLENLAIQLAAMQRKHRPTIDIVNIAVFAADHGVVEEGISAFPQAVTVEMVKNFSHGGAAISVLAKQLGASLDVVNVGTVTDPGELPYVLSKRISPGTANFCHAPAMTSNQFTEALLVGKERVEQYKKDDADLFIGGEMGIGNTTAAAAIACALLNRPAEQLAGPGTGLDTEGVSHKVAVINRALSQHSQQLADPREVLRCLGGLEIAALTGAYLRCAQIGLAVLVDGFISSVAALTAMRIQPDCQAWFILAHASAEPGHRHIVQEINKTPLLNLGMRLGEGSGAAIAVPLIRAACALHNNMATFSEAQVSNKADSNKPVTSKPVSSKPE